MQISCVIRTSLVARARHDSANELLMAVGPRINMRAGDYLVAERCHLIARGNHHACQKPQEETNALAPPAGSLPVFHELMSRPSP